MAKKPKPTPGLFELIEIEDAKEETAKKGECEHRIKHETQTVWPGWKSWTWTWTCAVCGFVWGRMPRR